MRLRVGLQTKRFAHDAHVKPVEMTIFHFYAITQYAFNDFQSIQSYVYYLNSFMTSSYALLQT